MDKIKVLLLISMMILFGFQSSYSLKIEKRSVQTQYNDTITWKKLAQLSYTKKKHKDFGLIDFPIVSPEIKRLNNKRVHISGFIIPIDNVNYAISKNVFASCYFCGKAGPESVMAIKFRAGKVKLKTDQFVILNGVLRINETDPNNWMYYINDAIIVKGE